jgi:hypothetical protein
LYLVGDNTTSILNDNNANTLTGGNGDDRLIGLGGNDSLVGGAGNDIINTAYALTPGWANDTVDGGAGSDTLAFSTLGDTSKTADLANQILTTTRGNISSTGDSTHTLAGLQASGHLPLLGIGADVAGQVDADHGGNNTSTLVTLMGAANTTDLNNTHFLVPILACDAYHPQATANRHAAKYDSSWRNCLTPCERPPPHTELSAISTWRHSEINLTSGCVMGRYWRLMVGRKPTIARSTIH